MTREDTELWGGPYPLSVGNVPPTQVKIWFNTVANELMVWNWKTLAWQPVSSTVVVRALPTVIGQLYIDPDQKLWVLVDNLCELTDPIPGGPTAADGAAFTASADPPLNPATGALWFVPQSQDLRIWNGFVWVRIGRGVAVTCVSAIMPDLECRRQSLASDGGRGHSVSFGYTRDRSAHPEATPRPRSRQHARHGTSEHGSQRGRADHPDLPKHQDHRGGGRTQFVLAAALMAAPVSCCAGWPAGAQ
jgi:hypothetical protein